MALIVSVVRSLVIPKLCLVPNSSDIIVMLMGLSPIRSAIIAGDELNWMSVEREKASIRCF